MTTFAIATLGCKVNTYESQGYAQAMKDANYHKVSFKEYADIYIINTCAVTNTAASKSRQKIHQAQALNKDALIVVVGCYVQTAIDSLKEDLGIDVFIGSDQKNQLLSLIEASYEGRKTQSVVHDVQGIRAFEAIRVTHFEHQTRAYLKIQDGCNQYCSYCIIPYARGQERSLHPDKVIENAKELVAHGHLEIVLTGIHTGRYGKEFNTTLPKLLKRLCVEVEGLRRIRISSIEMNEVSDDLLQLMKEEQKIARHLHIPIQSANTDILRRMNRPYDVAYYEERLQSIRKILPTISISSDVIVGFPDESEAQFLDTMKNLERMQLSFLHVFPFSKRDGTKAAVLKNQLDNKTKKARTTKLLSLSKQLYQAYKQSLVGNTVEVLWEKSEQGMLYGHTSEYVEVVCPFIKGKEKTMQNVCITSYENDVLQCVHQEVTT